MYNRVRFSFLKVFTKTSITYTLLACAAALILRLFSDVESFLPIGLSLCAIVFFRALGNPIGQDTEMSFFFTVPASAHSKVFYSVLAGTVSTALDVLPAVIASVVILGASSVEALVCYILAVAIDIYSSVVMLFITLSLPSSISLQVKQVIMIMFIYFGLIPIAFVIILGLIAELLIPCILIAALIALIIGAIVLAIAPLLVENGRK